MLPLQSGCCFSHLLPMLSLSGPNCTKRCLNSVCAYNSEAVKALARGATDGAERDIILKMWDVGLRNYELQDLNEEINKTLIKSIGKIKQFRLGSAKYSRRNVMVLDDDGNEVLGQKDATNDDLLCRLNGTPQETPDLPRVFTSIWSSSATPRCRSGGKHPHHSTSTICHDMQHKLGANEYSPPNMQSMES
ncbi:hypothetical protein EDC04DRAFT_3092037 [Pisolithus marmoratus]|nr:hypothetical protein EDC04DRAFT_3092037 [Pisolithus marmoratus]